MKVLAKSIDMISWTEKDGKIHPLKFKVFIENGESYVYKIRRIYNFEIEKYSGNKVYKFICEIINNNSIKICELRYDLDSCKWVLFKI